MRRSRFGFSVFGLVGLLACGGRSIEAPGSGGSAPNGPAPAGTTAGSAGKSNPGSSLPSHDLGTCQPGFVQSEQPERPCHWLTESGQCFADIDEACACVCPSDRDSVCFSSFDGGPNSATRVYCE